MRNYIPAWQHYENDRKGSLSLSLAVGKLADMTLLADNPMTIDPDRLATIKVQNTFKEGHEIWRR